MLLVIYGLVVAWLYTDKGGDYNVRGILDEALSTTGQIFVSKFMIAVKYHVPPESVQQLYTANYAPLLVTSKT